MIILKSLVLVAFIILFWASPVTAGSKNKRYIVKRNGQVNIEYHLTNPNLKSVNHLSSISKSQASSRTDLIEYAQEDIVLTTQFSKNESSNIQINKFGQGDQFNSQWALGYGAGGIEVEDGWDEAIGSSSVVVAVVDTGILNHSELNGRLVPGYDFVSDSIFGNDGGGRDSDPTDPGDWVTAGDPCYQGQFRASSWHGTHISGIIAANGENNYGMSGVDLRAKILPVRVLGKCGGYTSDIADGVRWAAGGHVSGVPINQNPAQVINLSLGGIGPCGQYMQDAINDARSRGAVIIVAAGNDGVSINDGRYTPANCNGVITVASNNQFGERSNFSNHGAMVDITAPGGGSGGGILSLGNSGHTTASSEIFIEYTGTSMSAPHVAAVASLIAAVKHGLFPNQVESILENAAKSFGFNSGCEFSNCGGGILNVLQSLLLAKSTVPDSSFDVDDEVIATEELGAGNLNYNYENGGGFCGSINIVGGSNSGPGNGPLSFFALIVLVFLASSIRTRKLLKIQN